MGLISKKKFIGILTTNVVVCLLLFLPKQETLAFTLNNCTDQEKTYTAQTGDNLSQIANQFGDIRFWEIIYVANADRISNPHLIFPGQILRIPELVFFFKETNLSAEDIFNRPFCDSSWISVDAIESDYLNNLDLNTIGELSEFEGDLSEDKRDDENVEDRTDAVPDIDGKTLEEFREAFFQVAGDTDNTDENQRQDEQEGEMELFLELDGMVLDETRTRIGRDFYDVFYRNWQAPSDARNYTITISEQPTPNLGTIISVSVNGTDTFRHRLQPRYDFIEQAGLYAVRMTYGHLEGNQQQMRIY